MSLAVSEVGAPISNAPDISIIVPTRNRPEKIVTCLQALSAQTYPHDRFEVIVVDDGSDVPLAPAITPFRASLPLRFVEQKRAGPACARNNGARHAAGRLLAFTDDDCEPGAGWLGAFDAHSRQNPDCAVGGETLNALGNNVYSSASQLLVDYLYEYYAAGTASENADDRKAPPFFTSNNLAVPAALFHEVGGFDESFPLAAGEDREFCDRWRARGYRLHRASDAVVRHAHALSLPTFWRQHINYGRGAFHLRKARASRGAAAFGFEPFAFYGGLLTYPIRAPRHQPELRLMALLFISQLANALGFVLEMRRDR